MLPVPGRQKHIDLCGLKASLVCIASSRPVSVTGLWATHSEFKSSTVTYWMMQDKSAILTCIENGLIFLKVVVRVKLLHTGIKA